MRMSPDERDPEGDFSAYCLSKDAGKTWSRRYVMGSGANLDAAWSTDPEKDGKIWQILGFVEAYPPGSEPGRTSHLDQMVSRRNGISAVERCSLALSGADPGDPNRNV